MGEYYVKDKNLGATKIPNQVLKQMEKKKVTIPTKYLYNTKK